MDFIHCKELEVRTTKVHILVVHCCLLSRSHLDSHDSSTGTLCSAFDVHLQDDCPTSFRSFRLLPHVFGGSRGFWIWLNCSSMLVWNLISCTMKPKIVTIASRPWLSSCSCRVRNVSSSSGAKPSGSKPTVTQSTNVELCHRILKRVSLEITREAHQCHLHANSRSAVITQKLIHFNVQMKRRSYQVRIRGEAGRAESSRPLAPLRKVQHNTRFSINEP